MLKDWIIRIAVVAVIVGGIGWINKTPVPAVKQPPHHEQTKQEQMK